MQKMQMQMASAQPAENSGLKVPGNTGGANRPGTKVSRPQNMTRATNGSEIARNAAAFTRPGTANIGR
jgi:hypothetical protein